MPSYFITANGTDIGKTFFTAAFAYQARQAGKKLRVLKPLQSGWSANDPMIDTRILARAAGLPDEESSWNKISPWRFTAPLAPNMAAKREGMELEFEDVVEFCGAGSNHCHPERSNAQSKDLFNPLQRTNGSFDSANATLRMTTPTPTPQPPTPDLHLIEGSGGLMSPITDQHTMLDLMRALNIPVILVSGTYLGAITHTLTAYEVLQKYNLPLAQLVITESHESIGMDETKHALTSYIPTPILTLPRVAPHMDAFTLVTVDILNPLLSFPSEA